jgi:hypothetical protein
LGHDWTGGADVGYGDHRYDDHRSAITGMAITGMAITGMAITGMAITGMAITGMAIEPCRFSPAHGAALLVFVMCCWLFARSGAAMRGPRPAMAQLPIALAIVGLLASCRDSCCTRFSLREAE